MTQAQIVESLRQGEPFAGMPQILVENVSFEERAATKAEANLTLNAGGRRVPVVLEVKTLCTPRIAEQLVPWLAQIKRARPGSAVALVCPRISPDSQRLCAENEVDFIDLSGNVYLNVPGTIYVLRTGMKAAPESSRTTFRDPFSGRASRVLRVLLNRRQVWRPGEIASALEEESERLGVDFRISLPTISKTLKSLEEELLIRRNGSLVTVPDPKRILMRWAEKYRERYRRRARTAVQIPNPFGATAEDVAKGLEGLEGTMAFTGAAAASEKAPLVDVDSMEIAATPSTAKLIQSRAQGPKRGPDLRIVFPADDGVFLYGTNLGSIPLVSEIQMFLDLYARGGRDTKQADLLMTSVIEPRWRAA